MRVFFLSLFLCFFFLGSFYAQNTLPWKKRVKLAQGFEKSGDLYQAAVYYEGVYEEKSDKEEYLYRAGICYYMLRDYVNAAKCFGNVKEAYDFYDKPGYKYALSLKQSGSLEKAKNEFKNFINTYSSEKEDYILIKKACESQIMGCDFALNKTKYTNNAISIIQLDAKINSNKTEFAPIPLSDNLLYFSSSVEGVSKIFRSQKIGDHWSRPHVPTIFDGKMEKLHYGNGTFTEDGKRFYFTQCDFPKGSPSCALYVMMKSNDNVWSVPIRLPDYINEDGANTTQPFVVLTDEKEILYFVSDREGGQGGLDIWFTTKTAESKSNNFTLPKNLGANINSTGDEVTPVYNKAEGILYYSSDGLVTAGGFDVFKSKGEKLKWEVPLNLGFPINSLADDIYYTISEPHGGGYLVSNRILKPLKLATTDDDIFYFSESHVVVSISGVITELGSPEAGPLTDVSVRLYRNGELVEEQILASAKYRFKLTPNSEFNIEIIKNGYNIEGFDINTNEFDHSEDIIRDIALTALLVEQPLVTEDPASEESAVEDPTLDESATEAPSTEEPVAEDPASEESAVEAPSTEEPVTEDPASEESAVEDPTLEESATEAPSTEEPVTEDPASEEAATEAAVSEDPAPEGTVYIIQVSAVHHFKSYMYDGLDNFGKLIFEDIDDGIKRVMVVPELLTNEGLEGYKSKNEALNVLSSIISETRFETAFIIRIVGGERVGEGFRSLEEARENSGF
ncbi:outer membrane peptidoglycan-associated protein [Aureispira]|nr:outer membrane peptidoglycan-associated protein [Aureispira sp.]